MSGREGPRIAPGTPREIGLVNAVLARVLGWASGGKPPHVFTTLARHRRLFRRWLWFAGGLMPGGLLARDETELVILHVATSMRCDYEWHHHVRLGKRAGLTDEAIEHVRRGMLDDSCFTARQRAFLRASRELHAERVLSDETFQELETLASDVEIIELCLLVGHYQMLAITLNSLRVPIEGT